MSQETTGTYERENEYHVLEEPGDNSDTNAGLQEGKHEYHVLDGMTPKVGGRGRRGARVIIIYIMYSFNLTQMKFWTYFR